MSSTAAEVEGLIEAGQYYLTRPYAPLTAIGSPISITVHYTIASMTSGMSFPLFGRLGLPDKYHIQYEFAMPIRGGQ